MNITIRQIQTFLQVAKFGSFTRAAERMHTMQPALSQQVRDLEAELGIRLFDRTTRRVELTAGGMEFRPIAAKIIEDLELATRHAHDLAERRRGRVALAAAPLLAGTVVPRAIAEFRKKFPGLEVKLIEARADQILELVRSGQADCGLGTFHPGETGISSTRLARDNLMVFFSASHPFAEGSSVAWRDLDGLPLIALTRQSNIRLLIEIGYENAKMRLAPAYEVVQITTALAMVEAGLGVAVLPTYAMAGARAINVSAATLEPRIAREVSLITSVDRSITPAMSTFARFFVREVGLRLPASADIKKRPPSRKKPR